MNRFKTGRRADVIARMAYHAVRDQDALIDANTPRYGKPDASQAAQIQACRDNIADYRRIANVAAKATP